MLLRVWVCLYTAVYGDGRVLPKTVHAMLYDFGPPMWPATAALLPQNTAAATTAYPCVYV